MSDHRNFNVSLESPHMHRILFVDCRKYDVRFLRGPHEISRSSIYNEQRLMRFEFFPFPAPFQDLAIHEAEFKARSTMPNENDHLDRGVNYGFTRKRPTPIVICSLIPGNLQCGTRQNQPAGDTQSCTRRQLWDWLCDCPIHVHKRRMYHPVGSGRSATIFAWPSFHLPWK